MVHFQEAADENHQLGSPTSVHRPEQDYSGPLKSNLEEEGVIASVFLNRITIEYAAHHRNLDI